MLTTVADSGTASGSFSIIDSQVCILFCIYIIANADIYFYGKVNIDPVLLIWILIPVQSYFFLQSLYDLGGEFFDKYGIL